ncbi:hypothetical protein MBANPS3_007018 [Mucor bainieri]
MPPRFGGAPKCPRCEKSVYMAEQVLGPGGQWHNSCLTCRECNKRLDSTTLTEKDNEAYCKTCYGRKWGPKGYGFAGGAAFLSTESKMPSEILKENYNDAAITRSASTTPSFPSRESPVLPPRTPPTLQSRETPSSSAPAPSTPPSLPSRPTTNNAPNRPPVPTSSKPAPSEASAVSYIKHQTGYVPRKFNFGSQPDTCAGCGKAVYAAELVLGAGNKYHKMCLKCCQCGKRLDSTNMVDRDFDLYCRGCYSKSFGPKGYGYGNLLTPEGATR